MKLRTWLAPAALALALAACGQQQSEQAPPPAAAPPAAEAPAPAAAAPDAASAVQSVSVEVGGLTGTSEAGQKVFAQCRSCHTIEAGGANLVGPNLHDIVGRPAGQVAGFAYTDANKNSGITWTEDQLFTYLENPAAKIPGTRMAFAGIRNPQQRADLIAFLKANSAS